MERHQFHRKIGEIISQNFRDYSILRDSACGGRSLLALSYKKDRLKSEFAEVDMILLKDKKVKVIFEIEESNVTPTQICGKFLASSLSRYCYSKKEEIKEIELADSILFIQILYKPRIRSNGNKEHQLEFLEQAINDLISNKFSNMKKYKLYTFNLEDDFSKMIRKIKEFLK